MFPFNAQLDSINVSYRVYSMYRGDQYICVAVGPMKLCEYRDLCMQLSAGRAATC